MQDRSLGPWFVAAHPLTSQTIPTPVAAMTKPALRSRLGGCVCRTAIIRFMPSGKSAYKVPSIAMASASAVRGTSSA